MRRDCSLPITEKSKFSWKNQTSKFWSISSPAQRNFEVCGNCLRAFQFTVWILYILVLPEDWALLQNMYNRELLAILLLQTSEQAVQDLTLEWLQRNSKMYQNQIYDPNYMQHIAFRDNWSQIKVCNHFPCLFLSISSAIRVYISSTPVLFIFILFSCYYVHCCLSHHILDVFAFI